MSEHTPANCLKVAVRISRILWMMKLMRGQGQLLAEFSAPVLNSLLRT